MVMCHLCFDFIHDHPFCSRTCNSFTSEHVHTEIFDGCLWTASKAYDDLSLDTDVNEIFKKSIECVIYVTDDKDDLFSVLV